MALVERALARTVGLPALPEDKLRVIACFVLDVGPPVPEVLCALLIVAVGTVTGLIPLLDGDWIDAVPDKLATHYRGERPTPGEMLDFLEPFLVWMHFEELLADGDLDYLHTRLDDARERAGQPRHRPRGEPFMTTPEAARLASRFLATRIDDDDVLELSDLLTISLIHGHAAGESFRFRPAACDPDSCAAHLEDLREMEGSGETDGFIRRILALAADYHRWLVDQGHLDPAAGTRIATRLAMLASAPRAAA